jgi:hypothetical protein
MPRLERGDFTSPETEADTNSEYGPIPQTFQRQVLGCIDQSGRLRIVQPVSNAPAEPFGTANPAYGRCHLGVKQSVIGGFNASFRIADK